MKSCTLVLLRSFGVLAALAAFVCVGAYADDNGHDSFNHGPMLSNGNGQTPFQKLKGLFDGGSPMLLDQFPTSRAAAADFECAQVYSDNETAVEQGSPVYRMTFEKSVAPAVPGAPAHGPLFPGTPDSPPVMTTINVLATAYWNYAHCVNVQKYNLNDFESIKYSLFETPVLWSRQYQSASSDNINGCKKGCWGTMEFRAKDGFLLIKSTVAPGNHPLRESYQYCWKAATPVRPVDRCI